MKRLTKEEIEKEERFKANLDLLKKNFGIKGVDLKLQFSSIDMMFIMDVVRLERTALESLGEEEKCKDFDPEIAFPNGNGKCKTCGKYHKED